MAKTRSREEGLYNIARESPRSRQFKSQLFNTTASLNGIPDWESVGIPMRRKHRENESIEEAFEDWE